MIPADLTRLADTAGNGGFPALQSPLIRQVNKRPRRLTLTAMSGALGEVMIQQHDQDMISAAAPDPSAVPAVGFAVSSSIGEFTGSASSHAFSKSAQTTQDQLTNASQASATIPAGRFRLRRSPPGGRRRSNVNVKAKLSVGTEPRRLSGIKRRACGDSIGPDLSPEVMAARAAAKFTRPSQLPKDLLSNSSEDDEDKNANLRRKHAFEFGVKAAEKKDGWAETVGAGVALSPRSFARGCKAAEVAARAAAQCRQRRAANSTPISGVGSPASTVAGRPTSAFSFSLNSKKKRVSAVRRSVMVGPTQGLSRPASAVSAPCSVATTPTNSSLVFSNLPSPSRSLILP